MATQTSHPSHKQADPKIVHTKQEGHPFPPNLSSWKATVQKPPKSSHMQIYTRKKILTSSLNQASRPLMSVSSSSNSPIPSKQARTMISVHPGTFLTMFGLASDKLIINSKALRRRVERSSRSSSFSSSSIEFWFECKLDGPGDEGDDEGDCDVPEESERGGKTNTPCRLLVMPPFPGKGRPTVGVGPQSTGGSIRAGKKVSKETKCGAKRMGWDVHSGVSVERNVDR